MKYYLKYAIALLQTISFLTCPLICEASIIDNPVGTIKGTAEVSLTGSATYQIPLIVPSGEYSFAPSISLVYNSHSGDQVAGYGWNLTGVSSIRRCGKTHYFDGEASEMSLSSADNLILDGERLLLASGSNLSEGAIYYPESDPKTKVVYHMINSSMVFSVYHGDGSVSEYGQGINSSLGQGNGKWLWLLNKITDLRGRTITYYYSTPVTNVIYVEKIAYDSNKSIRFSYESRLRSYPIYFAGKYICQSKRLSRISSYIQENKLNEYRLSYDDSDLYTRLTDITLYGNDGSTHFNPTHISYVGQTYGGEGNAPFSSRRVGQRVHYGDIDGDGRTDVVSLPLKQYYSTNDYLYAYLSKSQNGQLLFELADSIQLGTAFHDVTLRDINGDGICDITLLWYTTNDRARHDYYSCINGRLSYSGYVYTPWGGYDLGDYDGDGKTDFLNRLDNHIYGQSGNVIASANGLDWNYYITCDRFIPSQKIVCDVNGNGKEDLIVLKDDLRIYEMNGNAVTEITSFRNTNISQDYIIVLGDYNGDGYTDIIAQNRNSSETYNAKLYLSSGQSLINIASFTVPNPLRTADFNKDGKCDIFYRSEANGNTIYNLGISRGNSFVFSSNQSFCLHSSDFEGSNIIEEHYTLADFDGDGMDEFGFFHNEDAAIIKDFSNSQRLAVQEITDGLGNTTLFSYTSSSVPSLCTFTQHNYGYPLARPSKPMELVSRMELYARDSFLRTWYSMSYTYQDPVVHVSGKGFLGFAKCISSDDTREIVSITSNTFRLPYYYPFSSEILVKTYAGDSISMDTKNVSCIANPNIHPKAFIPYVNVQNHHDSLRDLNVIKTTTIDNYGNPTEIMIHYGDGLTDKEIITYENATSSKWIIGQPVSITKYQYDISSHTKEKQEIQYYPASRLVKRITSYKGLQDGKISEEDLTYSSGNVSTHSVKYYNSSTAQTMSYGYTSDHTNLSSVTDPCQQQTTYTYNNKGQKDSVVYPDGHVISYTYDTMGRVVEEIGNDTTSITTEWQWDSPRDGIVFCETTTMSDGTTRKVWRDAFGRVARNSSLRFDGSELTTDRLYNGKGQLWKVSLPYRTDNPTQWDVYSYNDDGMVSSINYASGKSVVYSYDKRNTTVTTDGVAIIKTINTKGELIKVSDPKGDIIYTLRPDGQPREVEALGVTTLFGYDSYDRRNSINDPSAGLRTFTYNENGQLYSEIDADGRSTTYVYDVYGRLSDVYRPEMATHYGYNNKNQLVSVSSDNGTGEVLTYDAFGRIATCKTLLPDNKYLKREYSYQAGNISATKYSNQSSTLGTERFTYANGCLKSISFGNYQVWQLQEENDMGLCITDKSASVYRRYSFDETGQPTGRRMLRNSTPLMNFSYSFNNSTGNLSWRKDVIRNKTENFEYDNINRLASYNGSTMTYDDKGNILGKSDAGLTMGYNLSSKPYAVTNITPGFAPTVVRYSQQHIAYNSFESPDTITDNGLTSTFTYNADGERAMMRSENYRIPTRYYVGNFYEEEHLNDTTTYRLYLGGDAYSAPAVYVWKSNSGSIYYIGRDHLGSITHITDNNGNLLHEYSYDPWGRLRNPSTQQVYDVGLEPRLFLGRGYCGHEHLDWCGLINMNARLYDPTLGRFLSPDPFVQAPDFSQNFNRYSYCLNNPLRFTDKDGEWFWQVGLSFLGAYIGGVAANGWEFNPVRWNYNSVSTFLGIGIGGMTGGIGGWGVASPGSVTFAGNMITPYGTIGGSMYKAGGTSNWRYGYGWTTIAGGSFNSYDLSVAKNVAVAIAKADWDYGSFAYASVASVAIASDDVTGYGVADDVLIPVAYGVATAGFLYDNWELIKKIDKEIESVLSKTRKENPGFVYELRARREGDYRNVRTNQTVHLKAGEIWKIGETTKGIARYNKNSYESKYFNMQPVFYGTKSEILKEEKIRLRDYYLQNGCLPPGNKIFR